MSPGAHDPVPPAPEEMDVDIGDDWTRGIALEEDMDTALANLAGAVSGKAGNVEKTAEIMEDIYDVDPDKGPEKLYKYADRLEDISEALLALRFRWLRGQEGDR